MEAVEGGCGGTWASSNSAVHCCHAAPCPGAHPQLSRMPPSPAPWQAKEARKAEVKARRAAFRGLLERTPTVRVDTPWRKAQDKLEGAPAVGLLLACQAGCWACCGPAGAAAVGCGLPERSALDMLARCLCALADPGPSATLPPLPHSAGCPQYDAPPSLAY